MVMKAGASNHDKVLIRKLHQQGEPVDIISASLKIRPAQVQSIIEQHQAGTLKIGGTGAGQPIPGDTDGHIQTLEPGAAEATLREQQEAEIKAKDDENAALREQLENMEAVLEAQTAPDTEDAESEQE